MEIKKFSQDRETQKQAVIEYSDLLNALNLVDYNDKFQILYFEVVMTEYCFMAVFMPILFQSNILLMI
jgi:uncharacterized pyridoxamine 5'-phosphate oxidase family protein